MYNTTADDGSTFTPVVGPQYTIEASTTTSVDSSLNPSIYGQSVVFTATIDNTSGSGGVPTGGVEFFDGLTDLGPGTPLSGSGTSATSTFTISTLSAVTHLIRAVYTATGGFLDSAGMTSQIVAALHITGTFTAADKIYNGNDSATVLTRNLVGAISGDDVSLTGGSATFDTKNIGIGKIVTLPGASLTGVDSGNYVLDSVATTTANITAAPLTITAITNTKDFDGTITAAAVPNVTGLQGTDSVTNLSETYDTATEGTGKTLSVATYTVNDGNGGLNYTVSTVANHTGVIVAGLETQLVLHTPPSAGVTAGQAFPTQPVIYIEDQYGNLVTADNSTQVTASLRVGTGPLLGTTTITVSGGIATFTNLADNKAESIILMFTARGLKKAQSNFITVNPAAASRLSITAPATATIGRPFTITVTAFDPYNNVAKGYRGTVRFASTDKGAVLPAGNAYTFTASDAGVHRFGYGVTLRTAGTQTIMATDGFNPRVTGSTSVVVGSLRASAGLSSLAAINDSNRGVTVTATATATEGQPSVALPARRSKAMAPGAAVSQRSLASAARTQAVAQADMALDHVLSGLKGKLLAYAIAERAAGAGSIERRTCREVASSRGTRRATRRPGTTGSSTRRVRLCISTFEILDSPFRPGRPGRLLSLGDPAWRQRRDPCVLRREPSPWQATSSVQPVE